MDPLDGGDAVAVGEREIQQHAVERLVGDLDLGVGDRRHDPDRVGADVGPVELLEQQGGVAGVVLDQEQAGAPPARLSDRRPCARRSRLAIIPDGPVGPRAPLADFSLANSSPSIVAPVRRRQQQGVTP
ncbi:MAG: hypothetical protein U5R31_07010 [Acidimicrobiia bacterium]|nr:hypothetical protein [Acidimicrobiia bacterium]